MILLLEDDRERLERFAAVLAALGQSFRSWRDAHAFIREAGPLLSSALLVSLDHDLEPEDGAPDPGDGYQVAQWLAVHPVAVPAIVHSSNGERSTWMLGAFELEQRRCVRVAPLGDDWIENDWRRAVRRILRRASASQEGRS